MTVTNDNSVELFRVEARDWLEENFPKALAGNAKLQAGDVHDAHNRHPDFLLWKARMGEKGWGVPTWPKPYGGGGLTPEEARVLAKEMKRIGAINPIVGMSVGLLGPTLLEYGNEEQKLRHLPPAARGELRWCQGYSEPGAGSDLASLQTRAIDDGDHFIVNGQKIWTSGAMYADWCFCLVRTDTTVKHDGISFLLIDMRSPGIEVRPIKLIYGASTFCEVFFTDVKVPKENLVGRLNGGWSVGKRLLQFERSGIGGGGGASTRKSVHDVALEYIGADANGRLDDPVLRDRIVAHEMKAQAVASTVKRVREGAKLNAGVSPTSSILKNAWVEVNQTRENLMMDVLGSQGLGWEGEGFTRAELALPRAWLGSKAGSIYGGTYEIQLNIISKRILGLPDPS